MAQLFGIDVGGTFTDLVVLDPATGRVSLSKAPTTPDDPSRGVVDAIARSDLDLATARTFFHGTTLGINTLLEHRGVTTGLITSKGFRDILEIGRMQWPMYRLHWRQPPPLIPRYLRRDVTERVRADGTVLHPLDEDELHEAVAELLAAGAESIAVAFLHAYAFPQHELRAGMLIERDFSGVAHSLSHQVTREYREYERTATTAADAAIKRRLVDYVEGLERGVAADGFRGELLLTRCDGGVMSAAEAKENCIRTLLSGPASGVMGAMALGRWLGEPNLLAMDMGGTSFDAALVAGGEPAFAASTHVEGFPLLVPAIELATIGAGGGSIAWVDDGGLLNVGPQSAGADPGPAAYGKGGTEPTFTDAAVVSGLLDPDYFLGGEITLEVQAARAAIQERIAAPLGLSLEDAASGIVALTEAKMAATLEEITIGKGHHPREFALLAYGGGGPLVACALAVRLEIPKVILPSLQSTFSAWGMLTLDVVHDLAQTSLAGLQSLSRAEVLARFADLVRQAHAVLDREGVSRDRQQAIRSVDMRYEGQEHSLTVNLDEVAFFADPGIERLHELFDEGHQAAYGYLMDSPVEVTTYRVRAVGSLDKPARPRIEAAEEPGAPVPKGRRTASHRDSGGRLEWTVYDRTMLRAGHRVSGPAIVEEPTSTSLLLPGWQAQVDDVGSLIVTRRWS